MTHLLALIISLARHMLHWPMVGIPQGGIFVQWVNTVETNIFSVGTCAEKNPDIIDTLFYFETSFRTEMDSESSNEIDQCNLFLVVFGHETILLFTLSCP